MYNVANVTCIMPGMGELELQKSHHLVCYMYVKHVFKLVHFLLGPINITNIGISGDETP